MRRLWPGDNLILLGSPQYVSVHEVVDEGEISRFSDGVVVVAVG